MKNCNEERREKNSSVFLSVEEFWRVNTDMESLVALHVSSVSSMPSSSYSQTSCGKSYTNTHKQLQQKSSLWGTTRYGLGSQALQPKQVRGEKSHHAGVARAYLERSSNPVADFFNRIQGSLPIVGLLSRIMSDEGGIGTDRIQLVEFCRKVERSCSQEASRAFYELSERHGPVAKPQYVLIWCWAAALGAGLLKSDDLLLAASRLRCSNDIQYETENLEMLMDDAQKRRAKSKSPVLNLSIETRAEKALDAIMKCCTGSSYLEEDDVPLLNTILTAVFPSADVLEIERIVSSRLPSSEDDVPSLEQTGEDQVTDEEVAEDLASSLAQ